MPFPSNIDLSSLDGTTGFKINGAAASDLSGWSVASAGDVNGDGFADLIVGARSADPNGRFGSGASYVVFGKDAGFGSSLDLSSLDGSTGFRLSGAAGNDSSGFSAASAGDVNGDGFADVIVGALFADPNGNSASGASYVVFGKAGGFASDIDLSSLDGSSGFRLSGHAPDDNSGHSVASAGDVNGDGFDDVIVGARYADPHGYESGASYVVFGKAGGFNANIDLSALDGSTGFRLSGEAFEQSGWSVASAGDVNGDGLADVIVGARYADANGAESGASYVLFGKNTGFASNIDLSSLDGSAGFKLSGVSMFDNSGHSVASAGDVNGDGFADLIIGARNPDSNGSKDSGASYVVFGKASGFASNIDLSALDGSNGFMLGGVAPYDNSGWSVASAGDVNGDGFGDVIVGARNADPHGSFSGASYVVFGKASGFASSISLSSLDGTTGFKLSGAEEADASGSSVASAGDINGDGFDDVIVGAFGANANGSGASYVVFGQQPTGTVAQIGAGASQKMQGGSAADLLAGMGGDDQLYGNGGSDILSGGDGNDVLRGGQGDDNMSGGAGDDTYYVDSGEDAVVEFAGEGTDTVHTSVSFTLDQHVENLTGHSDASLTLTGNSLANTITGGAGSDRLIGGNGADTLNGGYGNDVLNGGAGADTLNGGDGNDALNGGAGADAMDGGDGNDRYYVGHAGDSVTDSSGTDSIYTGIDYTLGAGIERLYANSDAGLALTGNGAANTIAGRGGNDTITGGGGRDVMTGGAGGDTFVFQALSDSVVGGGRDLIRDFAAGFDRIDFAAIDADTGLASDQAFSFIGGAAFSHTAGELRTQTLGANTLVAGDVDGNGVADFQILMSGHVTLQATDFLL